MNLKKKFITNRSLVIIGLVLITAGIAAFDVRISAIVLGTVLSLAGMELI